MKVALPRGGPSKARFLYCPRVGCLGWARTWRLRLPLDFLCLFPLFALHQLELGSFSSSWRFRPGQQPLSA